MTAAQIPKPDQRPTPAWVCAPGVLKIPFLSAFLPEYDLRPLPTPDVRAVIGWGLKSTAAAGRAWAQSRRVPYVALEDGFLRSIGIGESGATSQSLIADDLGVYYDARRPSRMEQAIGDAPDWLDAAMRSRTRDLIDSITRNRLSKTNLGEPLDRSILDQGRRRILIVDQTAGDASIDYGLASSASFADMMAAARTDEPRAQLIVKRHPAVAAGRKQGCIADLDGVTLLDQNVRPAELLEHVDGVYVVTSGMGFEALLRGVPVRCFGAPFYSGWGVTTDQIDTGRRVARNMEAIAAAALIHLPRYVDPVTGQRCEVEATVQRLIALRARAERLGGYWAGVGFSPAKRPPVRRLLNSPLGEMDYFASAKHAVAQAEARGGRVIYWAGKETEAIRTGVAATSAPVVRMEDGFIRSRGLGSDFFGALSVALDDQGVYYDPSRASRLETLIRTGRPDAAAQARAARLRARIVEAGLSKYNLTATTAPADWPTDRPRLLVVGQVENDRSILLGCGALRTNSGLVEAARAEHPDAYLIYRNHPDVLAGNRPGKLDTSAMAAVDATADGMDIIACLEACDTVLTLTSLAGFEALLRGKRVVTYGRPFYAGWGLTEDRMSFERRGGPVTLDALVHAALIDYPVYVAPNGWPCEAEDLVNALIDAQADPAPAAPANQVARWWKGIQASLDRSPPPSY